MVRTRIYLDPLQHRKLKREARERDISFAQLVRDIVEQHYQGTREKTFTKSDFLTIVGLGDSGREDVSTNHDRLAGEAISDHHK